MPSTSTVVTVLGSAAVAVGLLAAAARRFQSSSSSSSANSEFRDLEDIDDDNVDEAEFITEKDVVGFFERLIMEMQGVMIQLAQQIQAIQASGNMIPEKHLMMIIKSELTKALAFKQNQVLEELNIDEDCLEEATMEFLEQGNAKVKKAVETFQSFWQKSTGESSDTKGGGGGGASTKSSKMLSTDEIVRAAQVYFDAMAQCWGELSRGKNVRDPTVARQLQQQFVMTVDDHAETALHNQMGLTIQDFRKGMAQHEVNPQVARTLHRIYETHQQQLLSLGFPMMSM